MAGEVNSPIHKIAQSQPRSFSDSNAILEISEQIYNSKDLDLLVGEEIAGKVTVKKPGEKFVIETPKGELMVKTPLKLSNDVEIAFKVVANNERQINFQLIGLFKPGEDRNLIDSNSSQTAILFSFLKPKLNDLEVSPKPKVDVKMAENFFAKGSMSAVVLEVNEKSLGDYLQKLQKSDKNLSNIILNREFQLKIEDVSSIKNVLNENPIVNFNIIKNVSEVQEVVLKTDFLGHQGDFAIIKNEIGLFRVIDEKKQFQNGMKLDLTLKNIITNENKFLPIKFEAITKLADKWQSLSNALNLVKNVDRQFYDKIVNVILPKMIEQQEDVDLELVDFSKKELPDQLEALKKNEFASKIAHFFHGLSKGDLKDWFGDENLNVFQRILSDQGQEKIVKQIEEDFVLMKSLLKNHSNLNLNAELQMSHWQSFIIPLAAEGQFEQLIIYARKSLQDDSKENEAEQNEEESRFIIELDSKIAGKIQIDGIFSKKIKENQLNRGFGLTIRSAKSLPQKMELDISEIFKNSLEISGISGNVRFIQCEKFPVAPIKDVIAKYEGVSLVI